MAAKLIKTVCVRERNCREGESLTEVHKGTSTERAQSWRAVCRWAGETCRKPYNISLASISPLDLQTPSAQLTVFPSPLVAGVSHHIIIHLCRGDSAASQMGGVLGTIASSSQDSLRCIGEMAAALPRCCLKTCKNGSEALDTGCQL